MRKRQPLNSILSQFNSARTFVVRCLVQGRENFTFTAVLIFGIVSHGIKRTLCRHFSWNSLKSYPQRHLRISRSRLFCRPLAPKAQYTVLYVYAGLCLDIVNHYEISVESLITVLCVQFTFHSMNASLF